jgi:hypothetical protein
VINFRYHVVSLTAVFLALAIGLVVGTAALNGPVADSLKNQISALKQGQQQQARPDQPVPRGAQPRPGLRHRGRPRCSTAS